MSDLRELYQELVLDHGKSPRNFRVLENPDAESVGYNPLCGDKLVLFLRFEDDRVADISFQGIGCAISTASASLLTETLRGKTRAEAAELIEEFVAMLTNDDSEPDLEKLGKLAVFDGVKDFPVRVKCATLPWRTLESALSGNENDATTE